MRLPARLHLLLLGLACLLALAGPAADRTVLQGRVVGIVDGDTVDVRLESGMIRVRMHAIDAPESGQAHGKAAKAALSDLVYGRAVQVEPYEQDRYDRLVARVWLEAVDVNAEMIRTGNAWVYRKYADDPAYCVYEKSARDQRRGLWRLPPGERVAPWEWRQRKTRTSFTDYAAQDAAACAAELGR